MRQLECSIGRWTRACGMGVVALSLSAATIAGSQQSTPRRPNIIFILADDLGYGEVGCYGQTKIRTPNIDRLAEQGMRFTQHYSGNTVCAPSRCVLLTGLHTGHAYIRDNSELPTEGQRAIPADTVTIGTLLQKAGYRTSVFGKWGLGGPGTTGEPNKQGFDRWFGYLCQRAAHNYYPTYLWSDGQEFPLDRNPSFRAHQRIKEPPGDPRAYAKYSGGQYAPDLMIDEALAFIRENQRRPFLLYYATPVPHAAIQVPEDSLEDYLGQWPETPYLGEKGYLPHRAPRAGYAAMVTRMDRNVGRIMKLIGELGLDEDTLIIFSSDNGPTFNGGTDSEFFNSTGPLRGLKTELYEGGIRVPMIARWKGKIKPGSVSDHVSAFWDVLPTLAEIAGVDPPKGIDGISYPPTLLGKPRQKQHEYLYWEYQSRSGNQAVRMGRWKGLRREIARRRDAPIELYDLVNDIGESKNVADKHPDIVKRITEIMKTGRTESKHFPLPLSQPQLSDLPLIAKTGWKLVRVDSESKINGKLGPLAFDGDPKTHWHTQWRDAKPGHPHEIVIDLGKSHRIRGFRYLPRTDGGENGTILKYEFYISDDPDMLGKPAARGQFKRSTYEHEVLFDEVKGRYVCLRSLSEIDGRPFTCVAEISLLGE